MYPFAENGKDFQELIMKMKRIKYTFLYYSSKHFHLFALENNSNDSIKPLKKQ